MPLPDIGGVVTNTLEQLTERHFFWLQRVHTAWCDDEREAGANRIATSQQPRTARGAARLDKKLGQPNPLCRQLVYSGGTHAPTGVTVVRRHIAITKIIGEHEDDIRF